MTWNRSSRHARGYGTAWDKLRLRVLRRDGYLCQPCVRAGRITAAREVDHIRPKVKGGDDSEANLQAICSRCHSDKTMTDAGRTVKPATGIDGWPVEGGGAFEGPDAFTPRTDSDLD